MTIILVCLSLLFFDAVISAPLENWTNISYRLPTHITPINYDIAFTPRLKDDFTFSGVSIITLQVHEISRNITFHAKYLDFEQSSIVLDNGEEIVEVEDVSTQIDRDFFIITFKTEIIGGYNLTLNYNGTINFKPIGMFYGAYKSNTTQDSSV